MIDLIEYVVGELKSKRLSATNAAALVRQVSFHSPSVVGSSVLHPLLHRNTSDLSEQRYSSTFTGEEFFLKDHQVRIKVDRVQKVLPGVAYLEMVRAAVEQAWPERPESKVLELRDTVWARPIVVSEEKQISIALLPKDEEEIEFEIYSREAEEEIVHCQGRAVWSHQPPAARLDLDELKGRMGQGQMEPGSIYTAFERMGIVYGPAFQGIEAIYRGNSEVLAHLRLPDVAARDWEAYLLHPTLLDSALQACIGLVNGPLEYLASQPKVPFALEGLRITSPCSRVMFAWVRYAAGSKSTDSVVKLDLDLCDESGNVCAEIRGFSSRALKNEQEAPFHPREDIAAGLQLFVPVWNPILPEANENTLLTQSKRLLLVGGNQAILSWAQRSRPDVQQVFVPPAATIDLLEATLKDCSFDHLLWIAPDVIQDATYPDGDDHLIEQQELGVLCVFQIIKALLRLGYGYRELRWTIITRNTQNVTKDAQVQPVHSGIVGLIGSVAKEYPQWDISLLDVESVESVTLSECLSMRLDKHGNGLAYRKGEWFHQEFAYLPSLPESQPLCYRQNGVYVIIGGAGGLGEVWTRFMMENYRASVVWIGRRKRDTTIDNKINFLAKLGRAPLYISADASNRQELEEALQTILQTYPVIHGVVHSAIILRDQSMAGMEELDFKAALSAKLDTSVNLDRVFGKLKLDFVLFFSAASSFIKAAGQSSYAAGCTFQDCFAESLRRRRAYPVKTINWGYWGNVGIVAGEHYNKTMERLGIGSIEPNEGMACLQTFMASDLSQIAIMKRNRTDAQVAVGVNLSEKLICYPNAITPISRDQISQLRQTASDGLPPLELGLNNAGIEALATEILMASLRSLGLFTQGVRRISDLPLEQQPPQFYGRWLDSSISYLQRQNFLDSNLNSVLEPRALEELWLEWEREKAVWTANPDLKAQIDLLEACLKDLPAILGGKRLATDVIFPHSSMQLVEGVYRNNAQADYFNRVLGNTLLACIEQMRLRDSERKIRILELGAGTGGSTAPLLSLLRGFPIEEYCYTDVSRAFLLHADEQYRPQFPALRTAIFDVSKSPVAQSIAAGCYDVVIATNVLHATPNIRETLRNAKATLKHHGVLLLNEISNWSLFAHLTFGLLEGWWLHQDTPLRLPGSPGLSPEKWRQILTEEGYEAVFFPAEAAHKLGQQIIAGSSDGWVRQPVKKQAVAAEAPRFAQPGMAKDVTAKKELEGAEQSLREKSTIYFQKLVGSVLKILPDQIEPRRQLVDYGLDSILVGQLTYQLRKKFTEITGTLFFEVQTIDGLVDYFLENKKEALTAELLINSDVQERATVPERPATATPEEVPLQRHSRRMSRRTALKTAPGVPQTFQPAPNPCAVPAPIFDVAVIGLSGRYPRSSNLKEFWANLASGANCIAEIPEERWDWQNYYDPEKGKSGKMYTKWGGFIDGIDQFDPLFFKISPVEAKSMDPQERLFLESCYHAVEDAGYTPENLGKPEKIGVFVGVMNSRYSRQPGYFSMANRVSYLFNFQGPSMAVDTACSASLTAIHLALESLYSGSTDCAIAGGVNLIIDPVHYVQLAEMTMLSSGNRCKAFGDQADGFIDAEGVGAVVLKPLAQAQADGDHIYAVIKSSAINSGGRTNGYTVPNPIAQAEVVSRALDRARIPAEYVSYIEAHGTGTALGDPIEIAGLTRAFREAKSQKQFCSIGSLKSNIGHCESAAGIAGLTKVLLQLRYEQLVPSLHAEIPNPEIDFSQTPFKVQKQLEAWPRLLREVKGAMQEIPRIAGISSFGAGGANAHVIVQEYLPAESGVGSQPRPSLQGAKVAIVLSARDPEQLRQKARDLLDFVREEERFAAVSDKAVDLAAMGYTLQVGREVMEERLGLVVKTVEELVEKLEGYVKGEEQTEGRYEGQVKRNKEVLKLLSAEGALQDTLARWIEQGKLNKVVELWVKGMDVEWAKLYGERKPKRMSLPVYPFARERYWQEVTGRGAEGASEKRKDGRAGALHPMLHRNTSDFNEQRYSTELNGEEFYLRDHCVRVDGESVQKVMPGVAYLEMARAAMEEVLPPVEGASVLEFRDVVWALPIVVTENKQVNIRLLANEGPEIEYEIYSRAGEEEAVHGLGRMMFTAPEEAVAEVDVEKLRREMTQGRIEAERLYERLRGLGLEHGSGMKAVRWVEQGQGQVLAELHVPQEAERGNYGLHPSLLDGALQASVALMMTGDEEREKGQLRVPYSLERMRVEGEASVEMLAWVRWSGQKGEAEKVEKLDIDLFDRLGKVALRMRGLSVRQLSKQISKAAAPNHAVGRLIAAPLRKAIGEEEEVGAERLEYAEEHRITKQVEATAPVGSGDPAEKMQEYLRKQFSELLQLPSYKIDPHAALETYGMDSILALKLTRELEKVFGPLSKTLFFEYQNIADVARYFAKAYPTLVTQEIDVDRHRPAINVDSKQTIGESPTFVRPGKQRFRGGSNTTDDKQIAIVGLAGRYPQAADLREFWKNLQNGRDCITEIPSERWDNTLYFDPDRNKLGKSYSKWGGFIADVDKFDPLFFNMSPKEAELIDPQERLFLETVWETIEDAGYSKDSLCGKRVGVFVGVMWGQYELFGAEPALSGGAVPISSYASIANRVSYFFDFHGPSIALDTMCSSSMTAIYLACQELRNGTIEAAIAGGVNLTIHPNKYLSLSQGKFAASDGKCRSFGEGGDGYVPGEGVGAVLLKPLANALRDGDQIYAVIKSSTINHGGKTNGYTVPNPNAQGDLIREAVAKAHIDPRTLGYIETHGTGTSLGDPIEITGLLKVYEGITEKQFCPIGSVKSNIGHLESAAGIAAITKALLQIRYKQLVPSLHADPLNPNINFKDSPFYVQTELAEWKGTPSSPRRAAVSSFGAGGSNAHLILEEYAQSTEPAGSPTSSPEICIFSAKDQDALCRLAERLISFLEGGCKVSLADMAYTLQVGRTSMDARLAIVASSLEDLKGKLVLWINYRTVRGVALNGGGPEWEDVFSGHLKGQSGARDLIEGQTGTAFLEELLRNRRLQKIARLWVLGVDIDWSLMHRPSSPRKVSLPTYPFAKERCWVNYKPLAPHAVQETKLNAKENIRHESTEKKRLYYLPQWRAEPISVREERTARGPILILDSSEQIFRKMQKELQITGDHSVVILVRMGKSLREIEPNIYDVDPAREEQFHDLVQHLKGKDLLPWVIVHHDSEIFDLEDALQVDRHLNNGIYAMSYLCKALLKAKPHTPPKIVSVFSSDLQASAPLNAAMGGFLKTLSMEHPGYLVKVVDIENDVGKDEETLMAEKTNLIWDEIDDKNWTVPEIRYRIQRETSQHGYIRYINELVPETPDPTKLLALPLKSKGVYLITGGFGGLGSIFSGYLAKEFQAKLVLVGRSELNADRQKTIEQLKDYGSEVLFLQADVANLEQVQEVIRETKAQFGRIDGVIHSAGVNRDAFILKKTKDEIESVLASKVYGTVNVDLATSQEKLDFFVMFSSVAGVLGNYGQSDYAYANHFMDSFAERRDCLEKAQKRFGRTLSINWPLWEEGGMNLSPDDIKLLEKQTGICPMPAQEGIQYWEDFLRSDTLQGVAVYGIPFRVAAYIATTSAKSERDASGPRETVDMATLFAKTEAYLKALIGEEIKLAPERIGSSDRLESFGIDSVMINQLNANLERDLGTLPKTLLYEHDSVAEVAQFLLQQVREALITHFDVAASASEPASPSRQAEPAVIPEARQTTEIDGVGQAMIPQATQTTEIDGTGQALTSEATQTAEPDDKLEQIAIIGIHGYYPHSENLDEFWENLKQGKKLIDLVPPNRWNYEEFYDPDPAAAKNGKIYCKWGGFLNDYDKFDPLFFNISPEEARSMDPQERLFLQSVWAAIEDAGYTRDSLRKRFAKCHGADIGVFVGVTTNSYHLWAPEERSRGNHLLPSAMPWSIANRVSYFFDFNGPSMALDTACSSSLVAVHLACESLKRRECQVAIAGGVNLYLHPYKYQSLCQNRMLSLDGMCHSYGAGDDGFVPGESVGTLVLKPLSKAIADRDQIYSVIRASACDHSGRSKGYSAPNPNSQANVISRALGNAQVPPESVGCVEGHGTGTQLGDSLEVVALSKAFQKQTPKKQFCSIGSVKANIGHSESAAGIASLTKAALQIQHRQLVPSLCSDPPNPNIEFEKSPFYLQHHLSEWESSPGLPRRALINSFGAGGVNACVVLEEKYEEPNLIQNSRQPVPCLFVLSARNEERLHEYVNHLLTWLKSHPHFDLASLCYTLQVGREAMRERLAMVVSDAQQLIDRLHDWSQQGSSPHIYRGNPGLNQASKSRLNLQSVISGEQSMTEVASMWAAGQDVDWDSLYPTETPFRMSLPTYPFARERYWISDSLLSEEPELPTAQVHPLISYNSSTLRGISFASRLSDTEFYAVDHEVNEERIFPGAGFLEMACFAGNIAGEQRVRKIKDAVWIHPLSFSKGPQTLRTLLKPGVSDVAYKISSLDEENEEIVYSEGRLIFGSVLTDGADGEDRISVEALKAQCSSKLDGPAFYERFRKCGLNYGPSFQSVQEIFVSDSFAFARLKLADHLRPAFGQFILHPGLIDGAWQTAAGLVGNRELLTPYLPFVLDEVAILHPLRQICYAYAEFADSHGPNPDGVRKLNILLVNESGDVLVRFRHLFCKALVPSSPKLGSPVHAALVAGKAAAS